MSMLLSHRIPSELEMALLLNKAALARSLDIIKLLINFGANPGTQTLRLSIESGKLEMVEFILDNMEKNSSRFHLSELINLAGQVGNLEIFKFLDLKNSSNQFVDKVDYHEILESSIRRNNIEIVKYVFELGSVDFKQMHKYISAPLFCASDNGSLKIVKYLIGTGLVDLNLPNLEGNTSLWIASKKNHLDVVKALIECPSCNLEIENRQEETPLWIASSLNRLEIVKCLAERKVNLNKSNKNQESPLWIACQANNLQITKFLVENGADVEKADVVAATPLWTACYSGNFEIVKFLIEIGKANYEKPNNFGETPLFAACKETHWFKASPVKKSHMEIIKYLIDLGADVNKANFQGVAPLWNLSERTYDKIIEYVREKNKSN